MTGKENDSGSVDLREALGGGGGVSIQCFTLYVPDKDREGNEIGNQRMWVLAALNLLAQINGGATAMPPCDGVWLNEADETIWERPVLVYSHIVPDAFWENLTRIREFLHRMGRETNQGEVAFEFDGNFHRIRNFDQE